MEEEMNNKDLIAESHQAEVMVLAMSQGKDPALGVSVVNTIQRLARALEARQVDEAEPDAREHLHAKCDCVPDLGPAHCHLCSGDGSPVPWSECAAVVEARQVDEAAVEKVAQVIYQHSEVTDDGMVCQCGYRSECDLALHQARAVVEFLGERHEPGPESDPLRVRIQQLIDNQQSWIDAGRSGQAISRDAVRDSLQRVLDETEPEAEPAHRVHNHGPHEGDGLDCSELRGDDGLLRGRCVRGLEHFHVWSEVPCKPGECRMPVAPQPSESDVRERLVEAALETVDWDAIDAGEASPREAAGHAVWKALAALDGAPEPETAPENYEPKCNCEHVKRHTSPPLPVEGESK